MRSILFCLLFELCLAACSSAGYHYEGITQVSDDPCVKWSDALNSAVALSKLNATVGKKGGVPGEIVSVKDLAAPDTIELASVGITEPYPVMGSIWCHVTLNFSDHSNAGGMLDVADPGKYAPLQIAWISDEEIAKARARRYQLDTATYLLVKPDLTTPEVQRCVGRRTALGQAVEEFPGQLWAACADKGSPP